MRRSKYVRSHSTLILRSQLAIAAAALCALAAPATGIDYTWTGGDAVNNFWTDPDNWNPTGIPTAASNVTFPTLGTTITVATNGPFSLQANTIVFNSTDNINLNLLYAGFQRDIQLNGNTITRSVSSAGNHSISSDVIINASANWPINGAGTLSVGGIGESVAGLSFTKSGTGTLSVGFTEYSGTTTVSAGTLFVGGINSGAGNVTVVNGASIGPTALDNVTHALTINGNGAGGNGALRGPASNSTWSGAITLNTDSSIGVDTGGFLVVSGSITDGALTRSLTKVNTGTLILSGANNYNGNTNVNGGSLELDNAAAAGATSIFVNGGSVAPGDGITVNNSVFLNGSGTAGTGALRSPIAGAGSGTWSGSVVMQSNSSFGADTGQELVITGPLSGAFSPTKVGAGTVTLANTSSYSGTMSVAAGTLKLRNPNALSGFGANTVVSAGATMAIEETIAHVAVSMNRGVSLNGVGVDGDGALRNTVNSNTWAGAITLQSNSTVGIDNAADTFTISGAINGAFNLTKVGSGVLVLTNTANSYNNTFINEGLLNLTVVNALPAAGTLNVASGAAVQIQGGLVVNRALNISGSGISGSGALHSVSGANTWSGPLTTSGASTVINIDAGELSITGSVGGAGQLQKKGNGKLVLAGSNTFISADVQAGVLSLQSSGSLPVGSDVTSHPDTAIEMKGGISAAGSALLNGGGVSNTGSLRNVDGSNTWGGGITIGSADANIGADAGTQLTVSGVISGGAQGYPLTKVGAGTLVLAAINNYDGGTIINGGTLSISANKNLGNGASPVTTNNGGKLLVSADMSSSRTFNLNTGALGVAAGATLTYSNATVNGGFLRGPGTHAIAVNSSFSGVTALNGTNITQSQPTTLVNFTNAGTLSSSAAMTWDGGFNTSAGTINVNSSFNIQGFENDGTITVNSGASVANSGSPLVSGGGARITVSPGGSIDAGPSFELNGSLLVNNGTVAGITNVNYGSLAKGSGAYGVVNVNDGGRFSPGNSPGTVATGSTTWKSGGSYVVEIGNANHDLWLVNGLLNLDASSQHPFAISLASLDDLVFDHSHDDSWTILHADGSLINLDLAALALDISQFKSDLGGGHFSLQTTPNDIIVNFSAVPEAGMTSAFAIASLGSLLRIRRKA